MNINYKNLHIGITPIFALVVGGTYAIYTTVKKVANRLIDENKFENLDMDIKNQRLMLNK